MSTERNIPIQFSLLIRTKNGYTYRSSIINRMWIEDVAYNITTKQERELLTEKKVWNIEKMFLTYYTNLFIFENHTPGVVVIPVGEDRNHTIIQKDSIESITIIPA